MTLALEGRHALVTGAGRGIGAAVARRLAGEGARVTLIARNEIQLCTVADGIGAAAQAIAADVTNQASLTSAFERASTTFGPVEILVNNAGQARSGTLSRAADELWHEMLAVNLTGVYYGIRAALPSMLEHRFGRIVNVASTAGLRGYPFVSAYCAAKHGVIGLTRALALELAERNITVNAVCPGYTETSIVEEAIVNISNLTGRSPKDARAALIRANPQGRLIQPEEVAHAAVWLCQPGTESVTGQSITVAGGEVM